MKQRLNRETWAWDQLKHPNVLPFFGISNDAGEEGTAPALISPLCTKGHVLDYLIQNPQADRLKIVSYFRSVLTSPSLLYTGGRYRERFAILAFTWRDSW